MKNHQITADDLPKNIEQVLAASNGPVGSKHLIFCYDLDVAFAGPYYLVKENHVLKRETNSIESAVKMYNSLGGEGR